MEGSNALPHTRVPAAVIEVDPSGRIERVDGQAEQLFGWPARGLLGTSVGALVADRVGEPGPRGEDADLVLNALRRDGSQFPAEIRLRAVRREDASPRVSLTIRDIERSGEPDAVGRATTSGPERESPPTAQTLGALASSIAHDLNNSLSVIMIYSDLIERAREHRPVAYDLAQIRAAAERGAELTGQLAQLARRTRDDPATEKAPDRRDEDRLLRAIRMFALPEAEPEPIGVVVVDDHQMFAQSLALLLNSEEDIEVLGVGVDGHQAVALVDRLRPRVLLLDFEMPEGNGVLVATEIKARWPTTMIVLVTGSTDDRVLLRAIEAGCSGYLTKDRAAPEVASAVRVVAAGDALFSPAQMARLLPKLKPSSVGLGSNLTDREREVLSLLARGATTEVIATELILSESGAAELVDGILTALHAHSKLEAVATAIREGVIDYNSPF